MSYRTYIGTQTKINFEIFEGNTEFDFVLELVEHIDDLENIGNVIKLPNIYECMTTDSSAIIFDWDREFLLYNKKSCEESVKAFRSLCSLLRKHLKFKETAVFYAEWIGDPSGEIMKQIVDLSNIQIREVNIGHKTFLELLNL
ncbi:hypothetical protein [Sporosarcina sp. P1]|uniref:hypothetical protein n=1 Tax=Sporosarcina sp. P1 TaxID=2048257 RepID=UPI000C16B50F|nr:hypothetical protein [Sporosarcina sp. P1]PIC82959.1 hypothetical protein CSV73_09535 [Sporosarcina sp. P1]